MASIALINGQLCHALPLDDRGFAYGDGLFETIRVVDGRGVLWPQHLDRLRAGCARLQISLPSDLDARLLGWLDQLRQAMLERQPDFPVQDCVAKLIVTRGVGGRGYRPGVSHPTILLSLHPLPLALMDSQQRGLTAKVLDYRLVAQPALAGLKHLNRLDQVLASLELGEEDEGLLLNDAGWLIEGTKSNLLLVLGGRIITPELHGCGVAGVCRQWLIERWDGMPAVTVEPVGRARLDQAEGLALVNSVMGICPVVRLNGLELPIPNILRHLQTAVHATLKF